MGFSSLFSRRCCGGPVLALWLVCLALGMLFAFTGALIPGLVFIATGFLAEGMCLLLGQSRCRPTL